MEQDLRSLDPETLRTLYENESRALNSLLLGGALWEDVQEQRQKVTRLAIELHRKRATAQHPSHPAAKDSRPGQHSANA